MERSAAAPPHGATVEVRTYDAFLSKDGRGPDHAFLVVTDHRTGEQRVLRGGPEFSRGLPRVTAEMRPWSQSRERAVLDRGKAVTTLAKTWLPQADGQDLFRRGEALTDAYAKAAPRYGPLSNSNSVAQGGYRMMTGRRFADSQLWGADTVLPTELRPRRDSRTPPTLSRRP
ncbi:hypothetical protein [Phenylobacterium sp.]|uniref:hypothetical protein n=1 Tax=Phenylobacterium sp. TaxID=1871053 RepID=UPI0027337CB4|nr:hypothetical protein [Phenylobacterium sp.]MDP3854384.1 hypothetical protein [Phenylobacterium sp.]